MTDQGRTTAAAVVAGLGALLLTAPLPHDAVRQLAGAGTGTDPTGPLVAAVALLAWAITAWLALTVVLVLLSRVPGALGRAVRRVAGRVAPTAVRRAVEAALGLTVAVGVVTPTATLAAPPPSPTTTSTGVASDGGWDLDWPGRAGAPAAVPSSPTSTPTAGAATPVPVPSAGAAVPPSSTAAPSAPPPARPTRARPTTPQPAVPSSAAARSVVVQPGDSLWSLAEAALRRAGTAHPTDRQVAQAWPRWWAANREAVGADPDLLLPGTVLRPPAP